MSELTLQTRVRAHGLHPEIDNLKVKNFTRGVRHSGLGDEETQRQQRQEIAAALDKHDWNLRNAAAEIGTTDQTLARRIEGLGIERPRWTRAEEEQREETLKAVLRSGGKIQQAADEIGIGVPAIGARIEKYGLRPEVDRLRIANYLKGPWVSYGEEEREQLRQDLLALLERCAWSPAEAARECGVPTSTIKGRMKTLGVELPPVERESDESRRARVIDALKQRNGVLLHAAPLLGVSNTTLWSWCTELGINYRDYWTKPTGPPPDPARRAELIALLEANGWNHRRTGEALGVEKKTVASWMKAFEIERPARESDSDRLRRLIDALRLSSGVVVRAARILEVHAATVGNWCKEFDISPKEFSGK